MFNKQNLPTFRQEINEALEIIAKRHNVSMNIGNISFNSYEFTTKITCKSLTKSEPILKEYNGIKLGDRFRLNHKLFEVIDFKPNRPKNDVIIKEVMTDKEFKIRSASVKMALKK